MALKILLLWVEPACHSWLRECTQLVFFPPDCAQTRDHHVAAGVPPSLPWCGARSLQVAGQPHAHLTEIS